MLSRRTSLVLVQRAGGKEEARPQGWRPLCRTMAHVCVPNARNPRTCARTCVHALPCVRFSLTHTLLHRKRPASFTEGSRPRRRLFRSFYVDSLHAACATERLTYNNHVGTHTHTHTRRRDPGSNTGPSLQHEREVTRRNEKRSYATLGGCPGITARLLDRVPRIKQESRRLFPS